MAKRSSKPAGRPPADAAPWLGRGVCAKRCTWPTIAAGAVAVAIVLEVLLSAREDRARGSLCQDESGYVAHWKTDALDPNSGRPLAEHDFDCAEIGRNTVNRRNTRKRVDVGGKKFETYISVDCNNAEVAAKCRRTCGLCPDQAGEVKLSTHGHHRMLTQAEVSPPSLPPSLPRRTVPCCAPPCSEI